MWKQSAVASVVREKSKSSELNVSPGERFYIAHLVFQSTSRADDGRRALHIKWDTCCHACCFGPLATHVIVNDAELTWIVVRQPDF